MVHEESKFERTQFLNARGLFRLRFAACSACRPALRATNGLKRLNREIKRRTRFASSFPNSASCLRLVSVLLSECDEEWVTGKIYINQHAGVGITLTAANYVTFASPPWTPALMRQAEDRAYRNGQKRDVIVLVPIVAGTIDEAIMELLDSKSEIEADVVEGAMHARVAQLAQLVK